MSCNDCVGVLLLLWALSEPTSSGTWGFSVRSPTGSSASDLREADQARLGLIDHRQHPTFLLTNFISLIFKPL